MHVTLIPGSVKSGSQFTDGILCLVKVMLPPKHLNIIKLCVREYFDQVFWFLFHLETAINVKSTVGYPWIRFGIWQEEVF